MAVLGTLSTSFAAAVPRPWEGAASLRRMELPSVPSATSNASPHDAASATNPSDIRWLLPWAPTGTRSISAASVAGSPSEMRVSTSGRAAPTAAGTSCSCSPRAARAAKAPFWITTSRRSARSGTQTASSAGMLRALLGRQLFRARGPSSLREPFPRAAWVAVRHVWPPGHRPMRVGPRPPLPPGPLHLHLLPAPAHQGLLPGARRQALLPALLPQALRLTACGARPAERARHQRPRPSR